MIKRLKNHLRNALLRYLCNTFTEDEFLSVVISKTKKSILAGGEFDPVKSLVVGGKPLPDVEAAALSSEAKVILKFSLWRRLLSDMRALAIDKMVNRSKSTEDMYFSKAMLYTLDVLQKKLERIALV